MAVIAEAQTISVTEAARRLGIGRDLAYQAAGRGELPTVRIGRRILVPVAALEAMLRPSPPLREASDVLGSTTNTEA